MQQIHLDKDETEDAGLIKIDILSNRGLAQLVDADPNQWSLLEYPIRDSLTEDMLSSGNNIGLTFGESRGMRKLFIELRPRNIDDLAIALALIRPAASVGGRKAAFLERWKHGAEDMGDPLRKSILFDDDALVLIKCALECDDDAADKWRKVFSKQNPKWVFTGRIWTKQCERRKTKDTTWETKLNSYAF
jgi:error-prone DNA polymerase